MASVFIPTRAFYTSQIDARAPDWADWVAGGLTWWSQDAGRVGGQVVS
jgi:hypothetical protein